MPSPLSTRPVQLRDAPRAVPGAPGVFAAGDATDFPVRQGSVAAQQAELAARGVAALAGVPVEVDPLQATIYGALATGRKPMFITARVIGGSGSAGEVFDTCPWDPPTKVVATRLGPYLERLERYDPAAPAGHR